MLCAMPESTVLTLVRHGETRANLDGVWHGSTDTPLTERGHQQASRVAAYLGESATDAAAIYSSPLQRALHTAEAIARSLSIEPITDEGLREFDLGRWEGRTYESLYKDEQLWDHMKRDPDFAPHGGESPRDVTTRFTDTLRTIAGGHPTGRVVVVAHGGALSMALAHLLDGDYRQWERVMDNCAVSELVLEPTPRLIRFNHVAHLEGV